MRFVILGAGGLGSVVAGYLARAGHDVVMVGRRKHVDAVMKNGLHICGLADFTVRLQAAESLREVTGADMLFVAVKAKDTEEALSGVEHMNVKCAVSLQNGIRKNEHLKTIFGSIKVMGATTMIGGTLLEPGAVRHTLDGITFFGEMDGSISERVEQIAAAFIQAGFKASVTDHITSVEWTKQALQSPFASLSALTGLPVRNVWQSPALAELCIHMFREVAAVAHASGAVLSDHPAWSLFDMKTMGEAPLKEAVKKLLQIGQSAADQEEDTVIPSMLQDILLERKTEIGDTVGYVYEEGRRLGLSTPYTEFAYRSIKAIEENFEDRLIHAKTSS